MPLNLNARETLAELVALQDLQQQMARLAASPGYLDSADKLAEYDRMSNAYANRRPVAWAAARAALQAQASTPAGPPSTDSDWCPRQNAQHLLRNPQLAIETFGYEWAADVVRGLLESSTPPAALAQQANAWLAVCWALDECAPNWQEGAGVGQDMAAAAIRAMADQQAVRDELYAALVKLSNAYAFLKPPGYPKSDAEKQADSAINRALKSTNGGDAK
ncbi:hypothetical protein RAN3_2513 [plant metagenome]|uniref:Uncharacterized protein n=1 Tax=plant metagenome TaxID=1297885 RepID=A0A484U1U4_9ZZZZ